MEFFKPINIKVRKNIIKNSMDYKRFRNIKKSYSANIRFSPILISEIKKQAIAMKIPYQTLIHSVLEQVFDEKKDS